MRRAAVTLVVSMLASVGSVLPRAAEAAFPGGNGRITFRSERDGNKEVYVMNADGSGQANVTNDTDVDGDPAWSPDGARTSFVTERDGDSEVYVMNADGSGATNLTDSPGSDEFEPVWSPDGTRIAFVTTRDGNNNVYVMNADGSGQVGLTDHADADGQAAWSPMDPGSRSPRTGRGISRST